MSLKVQDYNLLNRILLTIATIPQSMPIISMMAVETISRSVDETRLRCETIEKQLHSHRVKVTQGLTKGDIDTAIGDVDQIQAEIDRDMIAFTSNSKGCETIPILAEKIKQISDTIDKVDRLCQELRQAYLVQRSRFDAICFVSTYDRAKEKERLARESMARLEGIEKDLALYQPLMRDSLSTIYNKLSWFRQKKIELEQDLVYQDHSEVRKKNQELQKTCGIHIDKCQRKLLPAAIAVSLINR